LAIVTTPGILLRSMDYRETSRIFRFYTLDHGLVSLIAKGIKRKRRSGSEGLESFSRGEIIFFHKKRGDLHHLKEFTLRKSGRNLGTDIFRFTAASVLGEIMLVQGTGERNPDVFSQLDIGLSRIEEVPDRLIVPTLLGEAWSLVATLGYRPEISRCIQCGADVAEDDGVGKFDLEAGGILCSVCGLHRIGPRVGPLARCQLIEFLNPEGERKLVRGCRAHVLLLRDFISWHVVEKGVLNSFNFLISLLESDFQGVLSHQELS